jgi:type III secretion protein W
MAFDANIRVDGPVISQPGETAGEAPRPPAQGSLHGLTFTVTSSTESLLANAAEELTFGVDNTDELELKERKEKSAVDPAFAERVRLYQRLMEVSGRLDQLDDLASALKGAADGRGALERAKEFFPDPADAWAALSELADSAEERGLDPKVIKEALAELDLDHGPEIRAAMAGALIGREFADLGSPLELKGEYVRVAIDFPGALEMLEDVLMRFGPEGFDRGVDFLTKSLSADLACDEPSRDKASLESVSGQLGHLRVLNGVRGLGEKLVQRWEGAHGQSGTELKDMDFVKMVLEGARDSYPSPSIVDPLLGKAKPPDIEREVLLRQDILNAVKNVAIHAIGDLERRDRLVGALQEGLDLAVAREDEYLASLEE